MNYRTIIKTIGMILCVEAMFMLAPLLLAVHDGDAEQVRGFAIAVATLLILGLPGLVTRKRGSLNPREGGVTVALAWIIMSVFGAIPIYASGVLPSVTDAIFETVSGFSTTGMTMLADVESVPRSILLWRSITHWLGGMGVLIFVMAIAPTASDGGSMFLLRAEFPGPMAGKLVPRMKKSALLLYEIYIIMTVLQTLLLMLGGETLFDSVNIAMSTVSTGGFSVRNDSLMSFSRYTQTVTAVFMLLCSMSFSIFYCVAAKEFLRIKKSQELRFYALILVSFTALIIVNMYGSFDAGGSLHHSLFQVISVISTTGYVTLDEGFWSPFAWALLTVLMITGPMAGSTGGGMKLSRVMILWQSVYRSIAKTVTPGAVKLVHLDGEQVDEETVSTVNSFVAAYLIAAVASAVVLALGGIAIKDGLTVAVSCLGNSGLGTAGVVLPSDGSVFAVFAKLVLCFDMYLGRLEIFPMLILLAPATWKK